MLPAPSEDPPPYEKDSLGETGGSSAPPEPSPSPDLDVVNTDASEAEETLSAVQKLVPSPVKFDMVSGRVRYFGPTASMAVISRANSTKLPERRETHWPICVVVRDLSPEAHGYLMDLFWEYHNSVIHLVHRDAFYEDQERGGTGFYSTFLHLAILATGFRYADKSRSDIQRLGVSGCTSSTLYERARAMSKLEMDRPGGIPAIQGLLLLGTLASASGNDDAGWLLTGWRSLSPFRWGA